MCFDVGERRELHVKLSVKRDDLTTQFVCPVQEGLEPGAYVRIDDTDKWWRITSMGLPFYPVKDQSLRRAGQGKYDSYGYYCGGD